jgi:hypothetical protein
VSFSSDETRWAPMLGGYLKNSDDTPNTRERVLITFKHRVRALGDNSSPLDCTSSKNLNPFTRALVPPFIRRRRDFYIPKMPSSSKNIPNVNAYKDVFFI